MEHKRFQSVRIGRGIPPKDETLNHPLLKDVDGRDRTVGVRAIRHVVDADHDAKYGEEKGSPDRRCR